MVLQKWNITGERPPVSPLHDAVTADKNRSPRRETLRQRCLDQLATAPPEVLGRTLHELQRKPHLQQQLLEVVMVKPKPSSCAQHLWQWASDREKMRTCFEALCSGKKQSTPSDCASTKTVVARTPLAKLATAIDEVCTLAEQTEESEAKELERIENSWHMRMDGRRARRYMQMLEKYGW